MAYQVFARKWRPKSFDSLKGQWHVVRALMNAIARGQYHHAYLFTGTRGVGKTTIARILAKAFNCVEGITSTPCGKCSVCVDIDAGRFVDLLEIDAASRTRVEDTRELLDNVQYAPTQGRFKIYLIDEVHMLSGHSFNALLKTLEEPPSHVIFILATTDPEKIPITVLSRCLRFNLRALPAADIVEQLKEILNAEGISFELAALEKLARLAQGSMRDALSLLEQAVAFSEGMLQTKEVEEMLGIVYERSMPSLLQSIVACDMEACLKITHEIASQGADFNEVCSSLQKAIYTLSLSQAIVSQDYLLSSLTEIDPAILNLKNSISPEELQLFYQIVSMGKRDLRYAPDAKTGFEMILLRMIAFRPGEVKKIALPSRPIQTPIQPTPQQLQPQPQIQPLPPIQPPAQQSPPQTTSFNWSTLVEQLPLSGLTAVLVRHCVVSAWNGERLELILDEVHKACLNDARLGQIQHAVSEAMGRAVRVTMVPGKINAQTPSMQKQAAVKAQENKAIHSIEQDAMVKNILSAFDAEVNNIVVKSEEA